MSLSKAFGKDTPPNIHNFTGVPETKRAEKIFDPERDITEEDWKGMLKELDKYRGNQWDVFSHLAFSIYSLFPERRAELELGETEFRAMLKRLNTYRITPNWYGFYNKAFDLLTLFPERRTELALGEVEIREMLRIINGNRGKDNNSNWHGFCFGAAYFINLFPDRREELNLGEEEFQEMLKILNGYRQGEQWDELVSHAFKLLTLFPERRAELNLGEAEFRGILNKLNQDRKRGNLHNFAVLASKLKIILADEIKRKEDGTLDIIFNKPKATELKEETPPLPVTRNY